MRISRFRNRTDAGERLAEAVVQAGVAVDVVVGLPRGGLPVAAPVAARLGVPLDVLVVRKLGAPHQPELAMGAIGEGGAEVVDRDLCRRAGVSEDALDRVRTREQAVLDQRLESYREVRPAVSLEGQHVLVVDDGVATGATMRAAIEVARARGAASVVVAVPVASPRAADEVQMHADGAIVLAAPDWFTAVGQAYDEFGQTSDDEVRRLLEAAAS